MPRITISLFLLLATPAAAQTSPVPPPYSLPWLLRPAAAGTVLRLDTTVTSYEDARSGAGGTTVVESFVATYKARPRLAPIFRLSWVHNSAPKGTPEASGRAFANPLLGVTYVRPLPRSWRLSLFGATTLPVGGGGGDSPAAGAATAVARGIPARSAMDNALFAVNYWTVIGGLGAARVTPRLTVQAEATVLQLTRVRGSQAQDRSRTNFTLGLHVGRFIVRQLSVGGEARLQRWLSDAAPARANPAARETLTAAVGARWHVKAGARWIRPGLSYTLSLDDPLRNQRYGTVQVDVPIAF